MDLAGKIDLTLLKQDVKSDEIEALCLAGMGHSFASICIPPYWLRKAKNLIDDSDLKICTVIDYPMGYASTSTKVEAIKAAIDNGADELDIVLNISAIKSGEWTFVENDLSSVIQMCHMRAKIAKVIVEEPVLGSKELKQICELAIKHEADFVKTTTGQLGNKASETAVKMLKRFLDDTPVKIKASGGINTKKQALSLLEAGADRLGCSSGLSIITEK